MIQIAQILCPIDFSECSRRALDHAVTMAGWYGARLTVLHVVSTPPTIDRASVTLEEAHREQLIADMRRFAVQAPPDLAVDVCVRQAADIPRDILEQAESVHADLIVIGSRGRPEVERSPLGSVTEPVMRESRCPTMVVPPRVPGTAPDDRVRFHRILCPLDFSAGSMSALSYALDIAESTQAQLTLLHVIAILPGQREASSSERGGMDGARAAAEADPLEQLNQLIPEAARQYCTVKTVVREGVPYSEILALARERGMDVIVMGVHGRRAADLPVFGSNTARVIRAATCPVLIVPLSNVTSGPRRASPSSMSAPDTLPDVRRAASLTRSTSDPRHLALDAHHDEVGVLFG